MCKIIVAMVLLSACRLGEEPLQQTKGFVSGDVVFDAENISKTTVAQCQNDSCRNKTLLSSTLHQVSLSDELIGGALQFNDLHISFELADKVYTCTRLTAPMGKMTLLQRGDDPNYCYAQEQGKDYVRQFALACLKESDWQLVAAGKLEALQEFTCKKDSIEISSVCFFDEDCHTGGWHENFKGIYERKNTEPKVLAHEGPKITAATKLTEVTITAEWKLAVSDVDCVAMEEKKNFGSTLNVKKEIIAFSDVNETVDNMANSFTCNEDDGQLSPKVYPAKGICVLMRGGYPKNVNECGADEADFIKITFAPKTN